MISRDEVKDQVWRILFDAVFEVKNNHLMDSISAKFDDLSVKVDFETPGVIFTSYFIHDNEENPDDLGATFIVGMEDGSKVYYTAKATKAGVSIDEEVKW